MSTEGTGEGTVATTEQAGTAGEGHEATALERAESYLPESATRHAPGLLPGEVRAHPDPLQYVIVAVVLVVVTGLEIGVSYMEGTIPNGLILLLLFVMALVKFFLVASWYMHLRTDQPVFRRFFVLGTVAAILLYAIVLLTLHVTFTTSG